MLTKIKSLFKIESKINSLSKQVKALEDKLESKVETNTQLILQLKAKLEEKSSEEKLLLGTLASSITRLADNVPNLQSTEFKVFSQWGDDGIIQYLLSQIEIPIKTFIEFGVENYTESNTRFLLMHNNWSGLIMDGSLDNIKYVKNDSIYWKYNLKAKTAFVTAENINDLIVEEGIQGEIGILHIDIDGNDYWIWKNVNAVNAAIVIVEYNSVFGADRAVTIPYQKDFIRSKAHYSNLYYGTSLLSLCDLAEEKGYYFVGCNSAGNNAYFVRKDKIGELHPISCQDGYVLSQFRESRDKSGALTFLTGEKRINEIEGLDVFNTRSNMLEKF
ncbi:hypothetical protein QNI19_02155 [Cytophagaceae bacterium DM2B3-1]|uniref:NADH dehydrogenase n=1 Tax=Xanthocytophaga flava TaxID=3048013 RepID=A0ABT7CDB6_9BACT|nr:hypothetical protein [Xanthocytophaga flavus]MDJ1491715.1 hypothetical protein [Xanthocytophaga flavus]